MLWRWWSKVATTAVILCATLSLSYAAPNPKQISPSSVSGREEQRWSSLTGGPLKIGKVDEHSCQLLRDTCDASPQSNQASCTSRFEKCIEDSINGDIHHSTPTDLHRTHVDASQWPSIWTPDQERFWITLGVFGRKCLSFPGTNKLSESWHKLMPAKSLESRTAFDAPNSGPMYPWVVHGGVNEFYRKLSKAVTGNVSPNPKDMTWDRFIFETAMSLDPSLQTAKDFTEMANYHAGVFSASCRSLANTIQRELDEEALESEISDPPDPAPQIAKAAKAKANEIPLLEIANLELYDQILDLSTPDGEPLKLLPGVDLTKIKDAMWSLKNGAQLSTPVVARQFIDSGFQIAPKASLVIHRSLYFDAKFPQIPQDPSQLIGMLTAKAVVSYFAVLPSFYAGPPDVLERPLISEIIRLASDSIVLFRAGIPFTATQLVDIGTKLGKPLMNAHGVTAREWSQNTVAQLACNLPNNLAVIEKFLSQLDTVVGSQISGLEVFQSSLKAAKSHGIVGRDASADASSIAAVTDNLSKTLLLSLLAGTHGTGAGLVGHLVPGRLRQKRATVIKKYGADAVRQAVAAKNIRFLEQIGIVDTSISSLSDLRTTTMSSIATSSFSASPSTLSISTTSSQPLETLASDTNISILTASTGFAKETEVPARYSEFYPQPFKSITTQVATGTSIAISTPPITSAESQSSSTSIANPPEPQDTKTDVGPTIIESTSSLPSLSMTETAAVLINTAIPTTMATSTRSSVIDYAPKFNETASNTISIESSASLQETGCIESSNSEYNTTVCWNKEKSSRADWKWTISWKEKPAS